MVEKNETIPLVLGLTGGIACGKSTISQQLEKDYGAIIINAERIGKDMCKTGEKLHKKLWDYFKLKGESDRYFNEDETLNRDNLAALIFNNEAEKKEIENIIHAEILLEIHTQKDAAVALGEKLIVLDVPLLIEAGIHKAVDKVVVVSITEKEQLKRLMKRDKLSEEDALLRIKALERKSLLESYAYLFFNNNSSKLMAKQELKNLMHYYGMRKIAKKNK